MEMKTHCDTDIFYSGVSVEIRRFKRGRGEVGAVTADFGADVETFRKEERRTHDAVRTESVEREPCAFHPLEVVDVADAGECREHELVSDAKRISRFGCRVVGADVAP
mgnify:FL=1